MNDPYSIDLKCRQCNADMTISDDRSTLVCPYCGFKRVIVDNERTRILLEHERLQREQEQYYNRLQRDDERLDQWLQMSQEHMQRSTERMQEIDREYKLIDFKYSRFSTIIVICGLVFAAFIPICFVTGRAVSGIIACIQTLLMIASWIFGAHIIKPPFKLFHLMLFIIGVSLILL